MSYSRGGFAPDMASLPRGCTFVFAEQNLWARCCLLAEAEHGYASMPPFVSSRERENLKRKSKSKKNTSNRYSYYWLTQSFPSNEMFIESVPHFRGHITCSGSFWWFVLISMKVTLNSAKTISGRQVFWSLVKAFSSLLVIFDFILDLLFRFYKSRSVNLGINTAFPVQTWNKKVFFRWVNSLSHWTFLSSWLVFQGPSTNLAIRHYPENEQT